jgi:hypothetical protein
MGKTSQLAAFTKKASNNLLAISPQDHIISWLNENYSEVNASF